MFFVVEHFQSQVLRPILLRLVKKSIVSCHIYTTIYYCGESLYVKNIIMSTISAATATGIPDLIANNRKSTLTV